MAKIRRFYIPVVLLMMGFLGGRLGAQGPELQLHVGPIYTSAEGGEQAKFPVMHIVLNLRGGEDKDQVYRASDLTLIEDGTSTNQAREVRRFDECGYGMAAIVAIDASGSMKGRPLEIIRQSLYKFTSEVRPQDKVGVLTFADDSRWDVPTNAPADQLRDRLQKIQARGHYTHLYDGLMDAMSGFQDSFPARRELTVISDGHDEGSAHTEDEVIALAIGTGVSIDAVGVTRSDERYLASLKHMAAETGGSYRKARNDEELQAIVTQALTRWKSTPVATFEASRLRGDGGRHTVGVRWSNGGLKGEAILITPLQPLARWWQNVWYWVTAGLLLLLTVILILWRRHRVLQQQASAQRLSAPKPPVSAVDAGNEERLPEDFFSQVGDEQNELDSQYGAPHRVKTKMEQKQRQQTRVLHLFEIPELEAISGNLEGKRFPVKSGRFWIGAAEANDLRIDDPTVSGQHACLQFENHVLMIEDNNSTNGTRINDAVLRGAKRSLSPGDVIQIGRNRFRLLERQGARS